jgi:hypothetical protein
MIALRASDCLSRKTFAGLERLVLAVVGPKNKRAFGLSQFMVTKVATSVQRTRWLVTDTRHAPERELWRSDHNRLVRCFRKLLV